MAAAAALPVAPNPAEATAAVFAMTSDRSVVAPIPAQNTAPTAPTTRSFGSWRMFRAASLNRPVPLRSFRSSRRLG
ncbi:hypothetical protein ACFFX0_32900 [Citricoccus parietis]|uniref:Secreted protein n=1 Tax=Citricoccus parietis TaxID=592307 RepID=A0ABV5G8J0_9MICC